MSILNLLVNLNSYNNLANCSNSKPAQVGFNWSNQVNGVSSGNILSQSQQVASSSSVTLFSGGPTYSFLYIETDTTVTLTINGTITMVINPLLVSGTTYSAPNMLSSDIVSLSVQNNTIGAANIFFAAVE